MKHQDKSIRMAIFVVIFHTANTGPNIIMWTEGKTFNIGNDAHIFCKYQRSQRPFLELLNYFHLLSEQYLFKKAVADVIWTVESY